MLVVEDIWEEKQGKQQELETAWLLYMKKQQKNAVNKRVKANNKDKYTT